MTDYNKYLKYKKKYLLLKKQLGGTTVPDISSLDKYNFTHSWFYMPIILAPFENIELIFPEDFDLEIEKINKKESDNPEHNNLGEMFGEIKTIRSLIRSMMNYYISKNIDLTNSENLTQLGYEFDNNLHISQHNQEDLLKKAKIYDDVSNLTNVIIMTKHGKNFVFRKK
jgi:hypothetical protein